MKEKYWYKITHVECPMCGHCTVVKERVYGEKPKDSKEVYFFEQDTACANYDIYMGSY